MARERINASTLFPGLNGDYIRNMKPIVGHLVELDWDHLIECHNDEALSRWGDWKGQAGIVFDTYGIRCRVYWYGLGEVTLPPRYALRVLA